MDLSGVKLYENVYTFDNAIVEVCKRLNIRFPNRHIDQSKIDLCGTEITLIVDSALGSLKSECIFAEVIQKKYTVKFKYDGKFYNMHTKDNIHFESDELNVTSIYSVDALKILRRKLSTQTGKKIDLKNVAIETFKENEKQYLFEVLFEGNSYEFCFNDKGETKNFYIT